MNARKEFEMILGGLYPVHNQALDDALKDMLDEAEEYGYDNGFEKGEQEAADDKSDDLSDDAVERIRARYEYLKHGGQWQMDLPPGLEGDERTAADKNYAAGFLDAMNLLGVKP